MQIYRKYVLGFYSLLILVLMAGCDKQETEEWPVDKTKYVFIEHSIVTHGQLINTPYDNNGPHIDFPTYTYNTSTKILTGLINFNISEDLKVVFGNSKSLTGFAGSGTASGLTGLTRLPYKYEQLEIAKIDADGIAYINYKGNAFTLKPGTDWSEVTEEIVTQKHGDRTGKVNMVTTDKIIYLGIWEKSDIVEE